jgi:hypothetical protein
VIGLKLANGAEPSAIDKCILFGESDINLLWRKIRFAARKPMCIKGIAKSDQGYLCLREMNVVLDN